MRTLIYRWQRETLRQALERRLSTCKTSWQQYQKQPLQTLLEGIVFSETAADQYVDRTPAADYDKLVSKVKYLETLFKARQAKEQIAQLHLRHPGWLQDAARQGKYKLNEGDQAA